MMPETERRLIPTTERRVHTHGGTPFGAVANTSDIVPECSMLIVGSMFGVNLAFFDCPCGMVTWMYAHPLWTENLAKRVGE